MTIFKDISDVTPVQTTEITTGLWSPDQTGSLSAVYTSSVQKAIAGEYFYDLYNLEPSNPANNAEVQFSVAYGHINGGGSPPLDDEILGGNSTLPTQVIYAQYRNILLASGSKFKFGTTESDDIYVININRARMKQALDPGNWELRLSGSNGIFKFVDKSNQTSTVYGNVTAASYYDIVSGSLSGMSIQYAPDTTVYGVVFPDYGAIILHPAAISSSVGFSGSTSANLNAVSTMATNVPFAPYTGSAATTYQYQHEALFRSISGSMVAGKPFIARSAEKVTSKNYSVFLQYSQYNFTNNPTYYYLSGSGAGAKYVPRSPFDKRRITYVTTIGLYNANKELVAVAKLSRPLQKSNDKSLLIRVRLDY